MSELATNFFGCYIVKGNSKKERVDDKNLSPTDDTESISPEERHKFRNRLSKKKSYDLLENYLFWSGRRKLYIELRKRKSIVYDDIKEIIENFCKKSSHLALKHKDQSNSYPMWSQFLCKCKWLLHNPATLPCGHTMCKKCVDESMFCLICGLTLDKPCAINMFLVEILSTWYANEYKATEFKHKSKKEIKEDRFDEALLSINKALVLCGEDYTALNIRAEIYNKLKQHENALKDSELSCKINCEDGESHFLRGQCYSNLGDLNSAIDAFQLCLELEPDNAILQAAVISSIDKMLSLPDPVNEINIAEELEELDSDSDTEGSPPKQVKISCSTSMDEKHPIDVKETDDSVDQLCKSEGNINGHVKQNIDAVELYSPKDQQSCSNNKKGNGCSNLPCTSKASDLSLCNTDKTIEKFLGVPKHMIKDDDFECKLCYDLLYNPVTAPCGHVFCRRCLLRTLDHNTSCPVCRMCLKDYLCNPEKAVTEIIVKMLEMYFGEAFAERERVYRNDLKKLSRVGIDEDVEIPIFVCSIAFPYVTCPLHIFEPKYRLMIRTCLESGSKKFGMCIPQSAQAADGDFSDIGTICEITKHQTLPDGRFIIHTIAGQRFLVKNKRIVDSLYYAEVNYFCDEPEDLRSEQFSAEPLCVYNQLASYMDCLRSSEQDCIFNALGKLPPFQQNYNDYKHGIPWVWWGLAALPLNLPAKLILLRSKCVSERMLSLQRFLRFVANLNKSRVGNK